MLAHGDPPHEVLWDKNGISICCDLPLDLADPHHAPLPDTAEDQFLVDIRSRVQDITFKALDQIERSITVGTPAARATMITRVLPTLIKAVTTDQTVDAEIEALKLVQADIMKAIHESVPTPVAPQDPGS